MPIKPNMNKYLMVYEAAQTITFLQRKNPDLMKRIEEVSEVKNIELINSKSN